MTIVGQTDADLALLLANDTDLFNRWDASQLLAKKLLLSLYVTASGLEVNPPSLHYLQSTCVVG